MGHRFAVVGGGIAGLAAALRLRERAPAGTDIIVYEQSGALGGKLRTGSVAGTTVDLGAEAFLARDPDGGDSAAVELARQVGLAGALVHPVTGRAAVAVGGRLHPIPGGTLVGVPGDLDALPPLAHASAAADRDGGGPLLGPDDDVAVGALVRRRLGDEVVDRLVDPMLGGVYAGRADDLSLVATMPALARAGRVAHTLTGAVRVALAAAPRPPGAPVFSTVSGGLSRLVEAVAAAADARLCLGLPVRELHRTATGWRLVIGATRDPRVEEADAVVLAVPAHPAARLLSGIHPAAAAGVGGLEYASVALVTLALPAAELPDLSGFLVPAAERTAVKAATFFTTKWGHLGAPAGLALVRASIGRHGEEHILQRPDDDLADAARAELGRLLGAALPAPVDARVQRWGGALPQYRPGHAAR
ncbi:MAG TPA: protoporphyrinogen oxidase, partial [Pilimelia sp.]|nr:protoporphyrinogen oxidase [Pilimelia sp.]